MLADDFQARCQATKPRRFAPRHNGKCGSHRFVRSPAGISRASYSPVRLAPVTPAADLPSSCHFASDKGKVSVLRTFGLSTVYVASSVQLMPASLLPCLVCLKKWCETHQTLQQGRQALVSTGRRSLAVQCRRGPLLSPRHAAGAVLARLRPAGSVSSSIAVVAAVRLQLPVSHRLGASWLD